MEGTWKNLIECQLQTISSLCWVRFFSYFTTQQLSKLFFTISFYQRSNEGNYPVWWKKQMKQKHKWFQQKVDRFKLFLFLQWCNQMRLCGKAHTSDSIIRWLIIFSVFKNKYKKTINFNLKMILFQNFNMKI